MCTMWITHGIIRPPDRSATEYLTCAWLYPIIRTKSPTLASILVVVCHVAFATYTSRDKQTCFSTLNNSIWVSWQGSNQETVVVVLRSKHWQIVATDFKVKLKPRVSRLHHVYDVDHIRHHPTSQSSGHWVPELCLIIPDPPHQVSHSCPDPHHCPSYCICHLHIRRQVNTFLHTE
jgi:hypothetical protein